MFSIQRQVCIFLTTGMVGVAAPVSVYANSAVEAEFDSNFLVGKTTNIDVERFRFGNPILPGEYLVDIYVNGNWISKQNLSFKNLKDKNVATTCFTAEDLQGFGVKHEVLFPNKVQQMADACRPINQWIDAAFYDYDASKLRMDISIPQIALQKNVDGYVDPSLWNRGINAGYLSYSGSAYKIMGADSKTLDTNNAFVSLNAGLNLGGWQFRHVGQYNWTDQAESNNASNYQAISTYAQRAFPKIKSLLTLGDSNTNGDIFDTFAFRGVNLSSDFRMLPTSQTGYAPVVRGIAKTNAKVEIRQQGQLIYQTTVSAGNFEITDLNPTGFGGNLDVQIIEATGEVQHMVVPFASVAEMLRPKMSKYALTAGEYRNSNSTKNPWVFQGTYKYGLNNLITAYAGSQITNQYYSLLLGAALGTRIGAFSFDATQSNYDSLNGDTKTGQSYRFSYSKLIAPTNTNLTLAAYRYSTQQYYSLADAMNLRDFEQQNLANSDTLHQKSQFQVTVSQTLGAKKGSLYLTGVWSDYWRNSQTNQQFQFGYNNSYNRFTYGLSVVRSKTQNNYTHASTQDTQLMASLSFPLDFKKLPSSVSVNASEDMQNISLSGTTLDNRWNYGVNATGNKQGDTSFGVNGRYRANFANFATNYNYSDTYQQLNASVSGNVLYVPKAGVFFSPESADTLVLVEAKNAEGAKVNNSPGLTINKSGYAVIPYAIPYQVNNISLDSQGMSNQADLQETRLKVVPFAGSINKVTFKTQTGYPIYLKVQDQHKQSLPFGAEVLNTRDEVIGFIGQGSMVYLRGDQLVGDLKVRWGGEADQQCQTHYDLSQNIADKQQLMIMGESLCQ